MANAHQLPTRPNDPNYNPPAPRKPRPGYHRIVVDWRPIPMQAAHVPLPIGTGKVARCELCFLALSSAGAAHFCRWKFDREGERDEERPHMRYAPVFRWVKDG